MSGGISGPRTLSMLAMVAATLLSWCQSADAEKRVALVIGNSSYRYVARLENPTNDARMVADRMRALGFALVGNGALIDLDKAGLDRAVQTFGRQLQGAEVGLFYYAGHGIQVRGSNYLVPVDANPTREADIDFQMLDVNLLLRQVEASGTQLNLVILDACRNNPFGGRGLRSASSGLAQMQAPEGTLISFATQPGNVALDGSDGNSPYAKALVEAVQMPGLDIFQTFNEVGLAVKKATAGAQQPWVSSSPISGRFYFSSAANAPPPAVATAPASTTAEADRVWAATKDTTSVAVLEEFIQHFGGTIYGDLARARQAELKRSPSNAPAEQPTRPLPGSVPAAGETRLASAPPTTPGELAVSSFYQALGIGNGDLAARYVVPEKRLSGPFSPRSLTEFYSRMAKPLSLAAVTAMADGTYRVRYAFTTSAGRTCDGVAIITTVQRGRDTFISTIKALNGC